MPRSAKLAFTGAGGALAMFVLIWLAAFHTAIGGRADRSIFDGFAGLQRPRVNQLAALIAEVCDPKPFVVLAAAIVVIALVRRRPRIAVAAATILVCANATTELLKPLLAGPHPVPWQRIGLASWPSGHATAAMSLALSAVLVAPARLRPVIASFGAAFAVAVSYSFLTLGWHYPSDVLGGFLVATSWALLTVGMLQTIDARRGLRPSATDGRPPSLPATLAPPALIIGGAALVGVLFAITRPHQVVVYASDHPVFVVGASAIGALGLFLATAVMLNLRR